MEKKKRQVSIAEENNKEEEVKKVVQTKTLLIWDGPERPHKKRDRKFYTSMISLVIVIGLILTLAGQLMIILLVCSLLFVTYALYTTPPGKTTFVLTNKGVELKEEGISWNEIDYYFISRELDETVINIDLKTNSLLKRRYLIPDSPETLEKATKILDEYVQKRTASQKETSKFTQALDKLGLVIKDE